MKNIPPHFKDLDQALAQALLSKEIRGYVFDHIQGIQVAHWNCLEEIVADSHVHDFDEYFLILKGIYFLIINGSEQSLTVGDEIIIPAGTPHSGRMGAGTSALHAFGSDLAEKLRMK